FSSETPSCQSVPISVYLNDVKGGEQGNMVNRVNTLSIYIPKSKMEKRPVDRLMKLSRSKERSINYLVVEAILQYLDREERKKK
ncbi:MAG: hypothetical protein DRH24_18760, partial [Deltaproteobacteria bacterium]